MQTIKAIIKQETIRGKVKTNLHFPFIETITERPDLNQIRDWCSAILFHLYNKLVLLGRDNFNLLKPIKIDVLINNKLEYCLMPVRLSKDRILYKDEKPFPLKNREYILRSFRSEKRLTEKFTIEKTHSFNSEKFFNTIEYKAVGLKSFGSPEISSQMESKRNKH